jgi:signal transduction histidine kinase
MKKTIVSVILICVLQFIHAQRNYIDSLKQKIASSRDDTTKVKLLYDIGQFYNWSYPDTGVLYAQNGLRLSEKLNYEKGQAYSMCNLGSSLTTLGDYANALNFGLKALALSKKIKEPGLIILAYGQIGDCYKDQGDYKKALENYYEALRLTDLLHIDKHTYNAYYSFTYYPYLLGSLSSTYEKSNQLNSALYYGKKAWEIKQTWSHLAYTLGSVHTKLGDKELALDFYKKAISLAIQENKVKDILDVYNGMAKLYKKERKKDSAVYYAKQAMTQQWSNTYPIGIEYYQQGLILRQQSGDKWGEAGSLDNIGSTHLKLGDWQQAIDFCKQSLAINQTTGDKKGQANALLHLAEIYKQTDDWQQAGNFCQESLQIRQSIGDKKGEAEILLFLAELQTDNFSQNPADKKAEENVLFERLFKALKIAEEIQAVDLLSKIHLAFYESYKLCENYGEALTHLELHIDIEKELHKDAINQKVLNLEISHRAEESKKEAEIFRLQNVELAGLYEESKKQKEEIEEQKKNVEKTLAELKATQVQLIQREKMASLGELTAGIAHEIQNPLNFVNNFSDVNTELIEEMEDAVLKSDREEIISIAADIKQNLQKIAHHGKRADAIVKGMLQHSRSSREEKEPTDINKLADEYLRLCYHGLRAKDPSFNVTLQTDFDNTIEKINIIPQDIGRVLLNLYNNAFFAVSDKNKEPKDGYEPTVSVSTKKVDDKIEINVSDNGNGIPRKVLDKIFQPFFTTKPTGQGTGLGLSLSYDIIKAHGGEIKVVTKEVEGTE